MRFDLLLKGPWGLTSLAVMFALLAIIGVTITHGFTVESALAGIVVGFGGVGGGYLLGKIARAL